MSQEADDLRRRRPGSGKLVSDGAPTARRGNWITSQLLPVFGSLYLLPDSVNSTEGLLLVGNWTWNVIQNDFFIWGSAECYSRAIIIHVESVINWILVLIIVLQMRYSKILVPLKIIADFERNNFSGFIIIQSCWGNHDKIFECFWRLCAENLEWQNKSWCGRLTSNFISILIALNKSVNSWKLLDISSTIVYNKYTNWCWNRYSTNFVYRISKFLCTSYCVLLLYNWE